MIIILKSRLLILLLLWGGSINVGAFWVGPNLDIYSLDNRKGVHQNITYDAISEFKYPLSSGGDVSFSNSAIKTIEDYNKNIDTDENTADENEYHCDNEEIEACSEVVLLSKRAVGLVAEYLVEGASSEEYKIQFNLMHKMIGGALHTLQDFYSHTNWINISLNINSTFGTGDFIYSQPGDTCKADSSTLLTPQLFLTSGYYIESSYYPQYVVTCGWNELDCFVGEVLDPQPLSLNAPYKDKDGFTKCVHGHVCNGKDDNILGVGLAGCKRFKGTPIGEGDEGIHKDSIYRQPDARNPAFLAPYEYTYNEARRQARLASQEFIKQVFEEIKRVVPASSDQDWIIKGLTGKIEPRTHELRLEITKGIFPYGSNYSQACKDEFGMLATQADWNQLASYYSSSKDINDFLAQSGFNERPIVWVSKDGQNSSGNTIGYIAQFLNRAVISPILFPENIGNYFFGLHYVNLTDRTTGLNYFVLCDISNI